MKKTSIYIAAGLLMASCSEKEFEPVNPSDKQGAEVTFLIGNSSPKSRTIYAADGWESETATDQTIFWGDYLQSGDNEKFAGNDQIRVFCNEAVSGRQIAAYKVSPAATGSNVAESVSKTGDYGVQWGEANTPHNFYAFYPATHCEASFSGGTPGVITAQVETGQSPCTYKVVRNGQTLLTGPDALFNLGNNQGTDAATDITTIYGQPDMAAAVMAAKTVVSAADYGKPVALNFSVLADVLDLTINGPITPNNLSGDNTNINQSTWVRKEYIHVKNVIIESSTGKSISGNFTLDLTNYNAKSMTGYTVNVINGSSTIQLNTAQVYNGNVSYPLLHIRSNDKTEVDKLRLRAFLLPGQVTNLDDITVTVQTDCGDYSQKLASQSVVKGQIHRVKFPFFQQAGFSFDFGKWMAQLDPKTYLSELSIPGSYASYSFGESGSNQYQNLDIAGQYAAGVRAFQLNIQCSRTYHLNTTYTYDGPFMQENNGVTLESVLNVLGTQMAQKANEFCVVVLSPKQNSGTWTWEGNTISGNPNQKEKLVQLTKDILNSNQYVYAGPITSETTLQDVISSGKRIIVKINMENDISISGVNALFSGWREAGATNVDVVPLQWGSPVGFDATSNMRWCYTEADNIGGSSGVGQVSVDGRKTALTNLVNKSFELYSERNHNTWIFGSIGGYIHTTTTSGGLFPTTTHHYSPTDCATTYNPWLNALLSDPNRQGCPMGIILMNFAGNSTYSGDALITTIINNNRAFTLQKKDN